MLVRAPRLRSRARGRASTLAAAVLAIASSASADTGDTEFDDTFGSSRAPAVRTEAATPKAADTQKAATAVAPTAPRERPSTLHNTLDGLSGGLHVVDAGSSKAPSARLSMGLDLFRRQGFLVDGALHRHGGTRLNVSVTPIDHLELAINTMARGDQDEGSSPQLLQTIGDTQIYAKGYARPKRWVTVGGDMQLAMLNALGGLGFQTNAASVGIRANGTFDLRELAKPRPLIVRTSLGYFFDNSARLIRALERYRYAALDAPAPVQNEYRHLTSAPERFAYGIDRLDHLSMAFGFEVPLEPKPGLHVHPLIEWNVAIPVNRQGYDCVVTRAPADTDGCLASAGASSRRSTLTLGARITPKVEGLALTAGLDIATSGARTLVRDIAPNAPYAILLQASYVFERSEPVAPQVVVERIEVPIELRRGHLLGMVVDDTTGAPVEHAFVDFEGHALTTQASDAQGRFKSYPLLPGRYVLHVSHAKYDDAVCAGELRDDYNDAELRCPLTPKLAQLQSLEGSVNTVNGLPIDGASVTLSGPLERTITSDASGTLRTSELPPGTYTVKAQAPGHTPYVGVLTVGETPAQLRITLAREAEVKHASIAQKRIRLKGTIQFLPESETLAPAGESLVAEVATLLRQHPEVAHVEVQGHTDDSGDESKNNTLSEGRAQAVVNALVASGVESSRLSAKGFGATRPIVPNITPVNRALNRRVDFVITDAE